MTPDGTDDRARREYDWSSVTAAAAVLETVGSVTGRSVETLPALSESVDPDSLNLMFDGGSTELLVSFRYADHEITVHSDGWVLAEPSG